MKRAPSVFTRQGGEEIARLHLAAVAARPEIGDA
jgi:hypothetical protein